MVKNFTDFDVWKDAHKLSLLVYTHTMSFPKEEQTGLSLQLRQVSVKISSVIAQAFSSTNTQESTRFYTLCDNLLYELKAQLLIAKDIQYLDPKVFNSIAKQANTTHNAVQKILYAHKPTYKHQGVKLQ
jgi:four helix bundle protein